MNQVIKTTEGYMVEMSNGDYACDANGDNTWFASMKQEMCC